MKSLHFQDMFSIFRDLVGLLLSLSSCSIADRCVGQCRLPRLLVAIWPGKSVVYFPRQ